MEIQSPNDKGYSLDQGIIKYKGMLFIGENLTLQTKLITSLHDSATGDHPGVHASYQGSNSFTNVLR
jgi:hypothetical protein